MTKRKLTAIILIGLLVLVGGSYPLYADNLSGGEGGAFEVDLPVSAGPAGELSFELATEFPEVGSTVMVYRVEGPDVTTGKVIEMGRRLGFQGDAGFIEDATGIAMIDESGGEMRQLTVWVDSGAMEYGFVEMDKLYPPMPPMLPSDGEAAEIATRFLAEAGLLPPSAQVSEVVPGGSYGGPEGTYVTHVLVRVGREIDGFPATGPGAKFGVRIGDKGEVVALFRVCREVEPYRDVSIKGPEQAYQELVAGGASYVAPLECRKVVVEKVSLAYWMEAARETQEYVVPVYEFKGKCLDKYGEYLEDFLGWSEAVE